MQAGLFSAVSSLGIHHRCPIKARTGSGRYDRHLHADPNPCHEQFTLPRRGPRLHHLDRSPSRDFHRPVVALCQPRNLAVCGVPHDASGTIGHSIPPDRRGDKTRDRQRELDGLEKWHFHLAIESLPVMLQIALLLLGCVLSRYLWTFSHTIAGVIITVTLKLFGVTLYVFLTLTATLYHSCPYRTPPSILIQTIIKYLARGDDTFARSLRSLMTSFPSVKDLGRILRRLRAGVRSALQSSG